MGQYHICWYPGSLRRQDICSHAIACMKNKPVPVLHGKKAFNSLWPSNAIQWHRSWSTLAKVMDFLPRSTKPLPEPMLINPPWGLVACTWDQFHSKCSRPIITTSAQDINSWNEFALQWRHNERDGVSNHQPHNCLLNCLFRHRWKKTSKLRVTGLYAGNSPVTGEFPAQRVSNAENVSTWWRHHEKYTCNITSAYIRTQCVNFVRHLGSAKWKGMKICVYISQNNFITKRF